VHLIAEPAAGPPVLAHPVHLGAGVHIVADPVRPSRWRELSVPAFDGLSAPIVEALVGPAAVDGIRRGAVSVRVTAAGADPWLRIAAVDALDRWLHLPLEQALVDAERAVCAGCAARGLPDGRARTLVLGQALQRARDASDGVVQFLNELTAQQTRLPRALRAGLHHLVKGYAELRGEVSGPDRRLSAVGPAWLRLRHRLAARRPAAPCPARGHGDPAAAVADPATTSMIDPRQLPARILGLAADPRHAEISMSGAAGRDVVLVRVPSFAGLARRRVPSLLAVRVVDRHDGGAHAHAPLTSGAGAWEATLPLCGLDASRVRVDVFDALSELPPAGTDADDGLQQARRATALVGGWRRLAALAQLTGEADAAGLRDLAHRLGPRDEPVFAGGPAPAELDALADRPDELRKRLDGRLSGGRLPQVGGVARLLVAELAALHVG
jgi:hypothetical protein